MKAEAAAIFFFLLCLLQVQVARSNTCSSVHVEYYVHSSRYTVGCGFWDFWQRCSRYRYQVRSRQKMVSACCPGYGGNAGYCEPICNGVVGDAGCNAPNGRCIAPRTCQCNVGSYGSRCIACPSIPHCYQVQCTTPSDVTCAVCERMGSNVTTSLYWPVEQRKVCRATCSYNNHWCWPGHCPDHLSSSCQCAQGFGKVYTDNVETKCQPTQLPEILYCKLEGIGATIVETKSGNPSTCQTEQDVYVNFNPPQVSVAVHAKWTVTGDQPTSPRYISAYSFGLSGGLLYFRRRAGSGGVPNSVTRNLGNSTDCGKPFNSSSPISETVECSLLLDNPSSSISDGDRLCVEMQVKAGGFLTYLDSDGASSSKQLYRETSNSRELCLRYDNSAPVHCSTVPTCSSRPIQLGTHITRSPSVRVVVSGWLDPAPSTVWGDGASGIEKMTLTVHDTQAQPSQVLVSHTALAAYDVTNGTADVILPRQPALYVMQVEVKDRAHNVRLARTVVLYDNSSTLELRENRKVNVTSASQREDGFWQTAGSQFCFSWEGRFYNTFLAVSKVLRPLKPDLAQGSYEHPGPQLPVSGTPNVDGVTTFTFSLKVNSTLVHGPATLQDLQSQSACVTARADDGDEVEMTVTASDVMGHVRSDAVRLRVDRSAPEVRLVSRAPGLQDTLYVHGEADLSSLQVRLEALDRHSGLLHLKWTLGHRESPGSIGNGTWPSHRLLTGVPCPPSVPCYCPVVGACEFYNYTLSMDRLIHTGDHNRHYVFTVTAENGAGLRTEVAMDILVDVSPPESGTVVEGVGDGLLQDEDFTSSEVIHVRWGGFVDHESGVFQYRVGLGHHCLTAEQLSAAELTSSSSQQNGSFLLVQEVTGTNARFTVRNQGKFYVTVVAYNKALMTSRPVCSDGVTRDVTPPAFRNVSIRGVGTRERISCHGNGVFLLRRNASLEELDAAACTGRCQNSGSPPWLEVLAVVTSTPHNYNKSAAICKRTLELSRTETTLYVPNDIFLSWDLEDEESQILETLIAFGTSPSGPDLEDFRATTATRRHHRNHEGLPSDTPLYVFLRASNKAGLAADVTLGPLVVDEAPPRAVRAFPVATNASAARLVLPPSHFLDNDEDVEALDLTVYVGTGVVAPHSPGLPAVAEGCPGSVEAGSRCFGASLATLRQAAGENPRDFVFLVEMRDLAGHVTFATSAPFSAPSLLPAGQGRVFDLDPNDSDPSEDVDFQRSSSKACVAWAGFRDTDDVSLFLGVGSAAGMDDVKAFSLVRNSSSPACLSDLRLQPNVRYVSTVKAVSLAGATLQSSDGFTVLGDSSFPVLKVWDGMGCREKTATSLEVFSGKDSTTLANASNLHPGVTYTLAAHNVTDLNVTSSDVIWLPLSQSSSSSRRPFLALSRSAKFLIGSPVSSLSVLQCVEDEDFTFYTVLPAHWSISTEQSVSPTHFSVSLLQNACSGEIASSCLDTVIEFESVGRSLYHEFPEVPLMAETTYHVGVRACFGHLCGAPSLSNGVMFHPHPPTASASSVSLGLENAASPCPTVLLQWQPFQCGTGAAPYYHVTLTEVERLSGQQNVFLSRGVAVSGRPSVRSDCRGTLTASSGGVQGCVRGVCPSGLEATRCRWLTSDPDPTPLYDLDTATHSPSDVIGRHGYEASDTRAARLRAADVDFVRSKVTLGAVLDLDWEGSLDWFLMSGTSLPVGKCSEDPACLHWIRTSSRTAQFPEMTLQDGQRYRICAMRSAPPGGQGNETSVQVCSDGFLVDDVPPSPPELRVANALGGFLRSLSTVYLQWSDVVDLDLSGRETGASGIASTAFFLGSIEGGSDVHPATVSQDSGVLLRTLNLTNGVTYYANLKVTDRVGLSSQVSRKFVVDTTPPAIGDVTAGDREGYVTSHVTEARWGGFKDAESGIGHFLVEVSSEGSHGDVFPATRFHGNSGSLQLQPVVDGHRYRLSVTAVNGAELMSTVTKVLIADSSPPTPGHVTSQVQTQGARTRLTGSWEGFWDFHSGLELYRAGLGTQPGLADVIPLSHLGLRQNVTWERILKSGQNYYVIVEACNAAGLCVTSSSLPVLVDTSPPLPGVVNVGPPGLPSHFLHDSTTLSAHWFNFLDPHSGISHYQWCLGTSPSRCDVSAYVNHSSMTSLYHGNLSLPINTDLYLRVRAFNKVGLSCVGISNPFRVDPTPPVFRSPPVFLDPYSNARRVTGKQWEDSVLVVDWEAGDQDSPLTSQHVTVWAHGSARLHDSLLEFGVSRLGPYVILLDGQKRLAPGENIRINVTACNAAGLCTQASSQPLLVDATPPTVGGFKPGMTWTSSSTSANVSLSWFGFEDAESEVSSFHVRVGRRYSDSVLPGGTVAIGNGSSSASLSLTTALSDGDSLVLTIWAENGVGLRSGVAKATVEAVAQDSRGGRGSLSIQRHSCDPHYCTGDCTCAVVGGRCPPPVEKGPCQEVPARSQIRVFLKPTRGGSGSATASSSCLWGEWEAEPEAERYEWSVGRQAAPGQEAVYGHDVFLPTEPVWHGLDRLTSFVHCLPSNRSLSHGIGYVAYVRVWYNASTYHVVTSSPLIVDLTPPSLRPATSVSASLAHVTSAPDLRYENASLQVAWPRLFLESQSNVTDHDVMVGTHPGGDDVLPAVSVGSRESYTVNVTLHEGVSYHVTVVAKNGVGLMTSHAAPPLLLDDEPPYPGLVFTSANYHDAHAQSDTSALGVSWHGFVDRHSAIARYQVAVVDTQSGPPSPSDFRSVTMATKTRIDGLSLRHGHVYRVHVQAVDTSGHVSEAALSSEIRVDATPPQAATCNAFKIVATLVFDSKSTRNSTPVMVDATTSQPIPVDLGPSGAILRLAGQEMYRLTFSGHAHFLEQGAGLTLQLDPALDPAPPGHAFILTLSPAAPEELTVLPPGGQTWSRVVNVTRCPASDVTSSTDAAHAVQIAMTSPRRAHVSVHVHDPESGVRQVKVGLGTTDGGFQIQPLKPLSGHVMLLPASLPHATPLYVTAYVENEAGATDVFTSHAVLDLTPPDVTLSDVKVIRATVTGSDKVMISGNWTVKDRESDVMGCLYGVGSAEGSISLLDWTSLYSPGSGLQAQPSTGYHGNSLQTTPFTAHHGDTCFLSLWCWNSRGLDTRVTSDPLPVYLRPPDSSAALVEMAADNVYSVTPTPQVQGTGGLVRMRWEGFRGNDVMGYQCRVRRGDETQLDWSDVGLKNHWSLDLGLVQAGTVVNITGEVRSYNHYGQTSSPVAASLLVDTRPPQLTGGSVKTNLTSQSSLLLDWSDVFSLPDHQVARFTVALGSLQGASDLLPPTSTSGQTHVFPVPSLSRQRPLHVTLRATLSSGLSSLYVGLVQP